MKRVVQLQSKQTYIVDIYSSVKLQKNSIDDSFIVRIDYNGHPERKGITEIKR